VLVLTLMETESYRTNTVEMTDKTMMIRTGTQQGGHRATHTVARPRPASQPVLRRQCACDRADDPVIAQAPGHAFANIAIHDEHGLPAVRDVLEREQGEPLERGVRDWAEGVFGHGLGGVRIHASRPAAQSARAIGAAAYTVGQHIVFSAGAYEPSSSAGRGLLAHELAHALQQGPVSRFDGLSIGRADDPAEREAEAIATRVNQDGAVPRAPTAAVAGGTVARAPEGQEPQSEPAADPSSDMCANYEKDRESMAVSIARELYRRAGQRPWPLATTANCKSNKDGVDCELRMGDGLLVHTHYNPASNTADGGIVDDRGRTKKILITCDMTYRCPNTWEVEFTSNCHARVKGLRPPDLFL
jgi:hypothetical protein